MLTVLWSRTNIVQVVVEVNVAGTQVSAEQGGVGCENGGNVLTLGAGGNQPQTRLPLVVVGHDGGVVMLGLLELEWGQWGLNGVMVSRYVCRKYVFYLLK